MDPKFPDTGKSDGLSQETVADHLGAAAVKHQVEETCAGAVPEACVNPQLHGSTHAAPSRQGESSEASHGRVNDCECSAKRTPQSAYFRASRALKSRRTTSVRILPIQQVKLNQILANPHEEEPTDSDTRGTLLSSKGRLQPHPQLASLPKQAPEKVGECSGSFSKASRSGSKEIHESFCRWYSKTETDCFPGADRIGSLRPTAPSEEVIEAQNGECSYQSSGDCTWFSDQGENSSTHKQCLTTGRNRESSSSPPRRSKPSARGSDGEGSSAEGEWRSRRSKARSSKRDCQRHLQVFDHRKQNMSPGKLHRGRQRVEEVQEETGRVVTDAVAAAADRRPLQVVFDATEILRGTSLNLPHLSVMVAMPLIATGLIFFSDALAMNDWFKATYAGRVETVGLWSYCVNRTCVSFTQERTHFAWPLWQSRLAMCLAFLVAVPSLCLSVKNLNDYWFHWRRLQHVDEALQFLVVALLFLFFAILFVTFTEIKRFSVNQALLVEPGLAYVIAFVGLFAIMAAIVLLQWSYLCCRLDRRSTRLLPLAW